MQTLDKKAPAFDFPRELMSFLETQLTVFGLRLKKDQTLQSLLNDFLTIQKKIVNPAPRKVMMSSVLSSKMSNLAQKDVILEIIQRLERGQNVNQFQSDRLFESRGHDQLLYEWSIHHFHLSTKPYKPDFRKRTPLLLYVYITQSIAIALDIDKHADNVFASEKWLEIMHDEFPSEIAKYLQEEHIIPVGENLSPEDRKKAWDSGLTLGLTRIRDRIYSSPGIGRTTSGHSILVISKANDIYRWVHTVQEQFEKFSSDIAKANQIAEANFDPYLIWDQKSGLKILNRPDKYEFLKFPQAYQITE